MNLQLGALNNAVSNQIRKRGEGITDIFLFPGLASSITECTPERIGGIFWEEGISSILLILWITTIVGKNQKHDGVSESPSKTEYDTMRLVSGGLLHGGREISKIMFNEDGIGVYYS